jgi:hypothetical protein
MSVRKIPKNHLFVTGGYSSSKSKEMVPFESLLEKDYLILRDFDPTVEKFETQPVRIPVPGVPKGYVPDVLSRHRRDPNTGVVRKPLLVDVKHTDDLKRNEKKYAPKFAAAHRYAENEGLEFSIVDQTQIRTARLAFLKFLREFRNVSPLEADIERVLECIGDRQSSSEVLLDKLTPTTEGRLYWLPIIWSMVLTGHLATDLDQPLTNDVQLRRTRDSL